MLCRNDESKVYQDIVSYKNICLNRNWVVDIISSIVYFDKVILAPNQEDIKLECLINFEYYIGNKLIFMNIEDVTLRCV